MTDRELYEYLMTKLDEAKDAHLDYVFAPERRNRSLTQEEWAKVPRFYQPEAYAELGYDLTKMDFDETGRKLIRETVVPKGTTVRVVMASRLGDLGITQDLRATHGYEMRVKPGNGFLVNCRLTRKSSS